MLAKQSFLRICFVFVVVHLSTSLWPFSFIWAYSPRKMKMNFSVSLLYSEKVKFLWWNGTSANLHLDNVTLREHGASSCNVVRGNFRGEHTMQFSLCEQCCVHCYSVCMGYHQGPANGEIDRLWERFCPPGSVDHLAERCFWKKKLCPLLKTICPLADNVNETFACVRT